jgi:hypothetical protein
MTGISLHMQWRLSNLLRFYDSLATVTTIR